MTKDEFEKVLDDFFFEGTTKKVVVMIGPGEDDGYLIIRDGKILYQASERGILIKRARMFSYLPYETIIALTAEE